MPWTPTVWSCRSCRSTSRRSTTSSWRRPGRHLEGARATRRSRGRNWTPSPRKFERRSLYADRRSRTPRGRPDRAPAGERRLPARLSDAAPGRELRRPPVGNAPARVPDRLVRRLCARSSVRAGRAARDDQCERRVRARHPDRLPQSARADAGARHRPAARPARRADDDRRRSRLSSTSRSAMRSGCGSPAVFGGAFMLLVLEIVIALGFAALGSWAALRTGSTEAVQGLFPVFFVFLFLSSMNMPRNLIQADWFRWVATVNPVSYLIEAVRSLVIEGWNWEALRARLRGGRRAQPRRVRARDARALSTAGANMKRHTRRRARRVVARVAHVLHEPGVPAPVARVSALLLHGIRRRPVAHLAGARASTSRRATPRSSSCSSCCSRPRSPGVFTGFRHRTRLRERLHAPPDARRAQPQWDPARLPGLRARPLADRGEPSSPLSHCWRR